MLVNECAWSRLRVCLLKLEVDLGSALESAWKEMEIWCVKGMYRLKLVSSESLKGFKCHCTLNHQCSDLYIASVARFG